MEVDGINASQLHLNLMYCTLQLYLCLGMKTYILAIWLSVNDYVVIYINHYFLYIGRGMYLSNAQ